MEQGRLAPDDPRHGTANGYGNLDCRCDACREAWRLDHYQWMHAVPGRLEAHNKRQRNAYRRARGLVECPCCGTAVPEARLGAADDHTTPADRTGAG